MFGKAECPHELWWCASETSLSLLAQGSACVATAFGTASARSMLSMCHIQIFRQTCFSKVHAEQVLPSFSDAENKIAGYSKERNGTKCKAWLKTYPQVDAPKIWNQTRRSITFRKIIKLRTWEKLYWWFLKVHWKHNQITNIDQWLILLLTNSKLFRRLSTRFRQYSRLSSSWHNNWPRKSWRPIHILIKHMWRVLDHTSAKQS